MPTRDRRRFVAQAVRYFLAQDYPARELVVLDDGADAVHHHATDVTGRFARRPDHPRGLSQPLDSPHDRAFYATLRADGAPAGAAAAAR